LNFGSNLQVRWGWKKGDTLLVFSPNSLDAPSVYWGCLWAGGIVSPANPTYGVDELMYQLKNSGAKAIVVHSSLFQTALSAAKNVGLPVSNIWISGPHSPATEMQHIESMLSSEIAGGSRPQVNPATDTAFLVYSSGTTGKPKGAMVTHTNFVADIILQRQVEGEHLDWRKDRLLALLPTYHIFGMDISQLLPLPDFFANEATQVSYVLCISLS
jgi:acyl-CoA synthetase (AMP-forming)/AMP-acid ligase II